MSKGGKLTLTIERVSDNEVCISVRDTGCGISPEKMARIFEVFYSTKHGGTGLGLAIVKQSVEAAGGHIEVESQVDVGTCLSVYLPLAQSACRAANDQGSADDEVQAER